MKRGSSRSLFSLFLVLLPGLAVSLLTLARYRSETPLRVWEAVPLLLALFLVAVALFQTGPNHRQVEGRIPVWSLPALGYLLVVGIPLLGGLFPAGSAGEIFNYLWLLLTGGAAVVLLIQQQHHTPLPALLWLLLGVAFLAQPVMILFAGLLLLPPALALRLAPTLRARATLLIAPALYWMVEVFLDPSYALQIWSDGKNVAIISALTLLPSLLFLVILPAGLMLARSRRQQVIAILPIPLLLLIGELWRNAFFAGTEHGAYTAAMWLTRTGAIAHVTLLLLWVLLACWSVSKAPPSHRPLAYWGEALGKTPN